MGGVAEGAHRDGQDGEQSADHAVRSGGDDPPSAFGFLPRPQGAPRSQ